MPKLRFKGFTDDWEQRKFGEFAQRQSETRMSDNEVPCVEYEDVIAEQGVLNKNIRAKENNKTGIVFSEDDVLYGKLRPYLHNWLNPDFKGVAVGDWWVLKPQDMDKNFLYRLLQTPQFDDAANQSTGTKMPRADWKLISNLEFRVPGSIEEQAKLGKHFNNLDNLITLHQRKCDELQKVKKYMLQKMFPKKGEKVPEIRLAGFTGDWEQRKLGEITTKIGSGKTPRGGSEAYVDDGISLIRSQNVHDDVVDLSDVVYIDEETNKSMENSLVAYNDVLLNITGASIGRSAVYKGSEPANVNQHVCIIRPTEDYSPDFIQMNLASSNGQKQIDSSQAGGAREGLNFQQIGKMEFAFPSVQEQNKIGTYFSNLNNLIALHQRKHDTLKEIKKYMLQNMFPKK